MTLGKVSGGAAGALPSVTFEWNQGSMAAWAEDFARLRRSTLPQCFGYADAMAREHGYLPRLARVFVDGAPLGMMQRLERRGLKFFHAHQLHRGPLWFDDLPGAVVLEAVWKALRKTCPRGLLHRTSTLPELPNRPEMAELMTRCGFHAVSPPYRTIWLDLTRPLDRIRAAWSSSARQRLKQAEKAGLVLDVDPNASNLPWLMSKERNQAELKGFRPLSGRFAVRLRNALAAQGGVIMISALRDGEVAASGLFFRHGTAATWQVGWVGEAGRQTHAMRLILWRGIELLKAQGVTALDLGGVNPDHAAGVTEFKLSLGGELVETLGLYR